MEGGRDGKRLDKGRTIATIIMFSTGLAASIKDRARVVYYLFRKELHRALTRM